MPISRHILRALLFLVLLAPAPAAASNWCRLAPDANLSPQSLEYAQKAVDVTGDLFEKHGIVIRKPVTVYLARDRESYARLWQAQTGQSAELARKQAELSGGVSVGGKPVVIINAPSLVSLQEAFRVIPHELFHQAQHQMGGDANYAGMPKWVWEGSAEVFQHMANEAAGIRTMRESREIVLRRLRTVRNLPDVTQYVTNQGWDALYMAGKGPLVYDSAILMVDYLVEEQGFDIFVYFMQLLYRGTSPDTAFRTAFRVTPGIFYGEFRRHLSSLL